MFHTRPDFYVDAVAAALSADPRLTLSRPAADEGLAELRAILPVPEPPSLERKSRDVLLDISLYVRCTYPQTNTFEFRVTEWQPHRGSEAEGTQELFHIQASIPRELQDYEMSSSAADEYVALAEAMNSTLSDYPPHQQPVVSILTDIGNLVNKVQRAWFDEHKSEAKQKGKPLYEKDAQEEKPKFTLVMPDKPATQKAAVPIPVYTDQPPAEGALLHFGFTESELQEKIAEGNLYVNRHQGGEFFPVLRYLPVWFEVYSNGDKAEHAEPALLSRSGQYLALSLIRTEDFFTVRSAFPPPKNPFQN